MGKDMEEGNFCFLMEGCIKAIGKMMHLLDFVDLLEVMAIFIK
jgi:hypothetical protein